MNCTQAKDLLSGYYDGELAPADHTEVAGHLAQCASCSANLAGYQRLSKLSSQLPAPAPANDWRDLELQLRTTAPASPGWKNWFNQSGRRLAIAAVLLIGIGMALHFGNNPPGSSLQHPSANLDRYLTEFAKSPEAAQQYLLASYRGQETDFPRAEQLIGYQPVAESPPPGFTVEAVYVLDMPCCRCPQVSLRRPDSSRLIVFECQCQMDEPVRFGDRSAIQTTCCGKPTRIIEAEQQLLAASWRSENRNLTVVGARDIQEIAMVVGHFSGDGADHAEHPF
jgi:hypothetical protein